MSILYFDCFSGVSGDMVIGALIQAGADPVLMEKELKKLNIEEEYQLKWNTVIKNGISSIKFDVELTEKVNQHTRSHDDGHTHSHEHSHDKGHAHSHEHSHDKGHAHSHEHGHDEGHAHSHEHSHDEGHAHSHEHSHDKGHAHSHEHSHDEGHAHSHEHGHDGGHAHRHNDHNHYGQRNYQEIIQMIENAGFTESVKDMALRIFRKIGEAEGRIHGIPLEKVHFHEVGAVDSIIDIIGGAILIDQLNITRFKSSPIPVGTGKIKIDHGVYPVPAPATLEILKGVPISQSDIRGELATPTGAAIVAVLAEEYCPIPSMKIQAIGYGAGTKTFNEHPNVLRIIIGE